MASTIERPSRSRSPRCCAQGFVVRPTRWSRLPVRDAARTPFLRCSPRRFYVRASATFPMRRPQTPPLPAYLCTPSVTRGARRRDGQMARRDEGKSLESRPKKHDLMPGRRASSLSLVACCRGDRASRRVPSLRGNLPRPSSADEHAAASERGPTRRARRGQSPSLVPPCRHGGSAGAGRPPPGPRRRCRDHRTLAFVVHHLR